jgi:hypothetical protein
MDLVPDEWKELHNELLYNFYFTLTSFGIMSLRDVIRGGQNTYAGTVSPSFFVIPLLKASRRRSIIIYHRAISLAR